MEYNGVFIGKYEDSILNTIRTPGVYSREWWGKILVKPASSSATVAKTCRTLFSYRLIFKSSPHFCQTRQTPPSLSLPLFACSSPSPSMTTSFLPPLSPSSSPPRSHSPMSRMFLYVLSIRPFRGIINDFKSRLPYYISDWTDAWNYRVVPATALTFFSKQVFLLLLAFLMLTYCVVSFQESHSPWTSSRPLTNTASPKCSCPLSWLLRCFRSLGRSRCVLLE